MHVQCINTRFMWLIFTAFMYVNVFVCRFFFCVNFSQVVWIIVWLVHGLKVYILLVVYWTLCCHLVYVSTHSEHAVACVSVQLELTDSALLHLLMFVCINCCKYKYDCVLGYYFGSLPSLPCIRQHLSNGDCPEDKREDDQNCSVLSVLYCVRQLCTVIRTHTNSFYSWLLVQV